MSTFSKMTGIVGFVVVLGLGIEDAVAQCPDPPANHDCKCNGDNTRWVCADWSQGAAPAEDSDFFVTYTGNVPEVKFAAADSAWIIYSEALDENGDPTGAAELGAVLLADDVSPDSGDFNVSIKNGATFGATDVASLVLDSSDTSWTGGSDLGSTLISGSVNGAITLVEDSGGGEGAVTALVLILGDVSGPITIPAVEATVSILGDYGVGSVSNDIDLGVIDGGASFTIAGDVLSNSSIALAIDIDSVGTSTGSGSSGFFEITGDLTNANATVTVTDMVDVSGKSATVNIKGDFGGTLDLTQGVRGLPADNLVTIGTLLTPVSGNGGKIKLNNKDIAGSLILTGAQTGTEILNGGDVSGVLYPSQSGGTFAGTATFTGVAAGGQIYAFDESLHTADVAGKRTVTNHYAGLFKVDGDLTSTATLTINGDLKASSGDDGLIWIVEEAAGDVHIKTDLIGHVHYPKTFASGGTVTVDGDVTSSGFFKAGDGISSETHAGDLIFNGNVVGDILHHGNMSGDTTITDDLSGDFQVDAVLSGDLTISGALANAGLGGGRILLNGAPTGGVKVGKKTGSLTLIQAKSGLGTGSTIEINTTEGNFDAEGDMHFGGSTPTDLPFDGCIHIYDSSPSGHFGDLDGDIDIVMCHTDGEDLNICIDGEDNGNVNLDQTGCTYTTADWSCNTCP